MSFTLGLVVAEVVDDFDSSRDGVESLLVSRPVERKRYICVSLTAYRRVVIRIPINWVIIF